MEELNKEGGRGNAVSPYRKGAPFWRDSAEPRVPQAQGAKRPSSSTPLIGWKISLINAIIVFIKMDQTQKKELEELTADARRLGGRL